MNARTSNVILPPGARLLQNVPYGSDTAQKMDVYIPKGVCRAPIVKRGNDSP